LAAGETCLHPTSTPTSPSHSKIETKMLIISIISTLLSNAVNARRDVSILYNRIAILILFYCILNDLSSLNIVTKGIGIHGGLLLVNNITQIFHIFVYIISALILVLTSFYPRKV
jgi:NADH-ubiquinone oxidoreductase chain 2